jgi:DMSO/TMAO reductase YedYZ molybdopterin-dependent catalytic subunit
MTYLKPPDAAARLPRRGFLKKLGAIVGAAYATGAGGLSALGAELVRMPFAHGERRLARFPQKRPLLLLRSWPPLLETPMSVFDRGVFTPNDAFYVRWHLGHIPTDIDVPKFRLRIHGHVKKPVELTLDEIQREFKAVELAAVNQCSGNSRGFFEPRVPGGEWGNGAMGNALWTGVKLADLLNRAGIKTGAVQVRFNGMDSGNVAATPDFMKSLSVDHAMDGEVMAAYGMNRAALPFLNGFPLRLVVPGWYATYWVKMLNDIEVLDHPDDNFWMKSAYLIPDTPGANIKPGESAKMVPINRMEPRSFITNLTDGAAVRAGSSTEVRGIAFGGDTGLAKVMFSADAGKTWHPAHLDEDHGKYSFRRWSARFDPVNPGAYTLMSKAVNANGVAQPMQPNWNPGGFMRNVVESVRVRAA